MMAEMGWPQYYADLESFDFAEFCEIDIAIELDRLSSEGLRFVEAPTLQAGDLPAQLANVHHTLRYVSTVAQWPLILHDDMLEWRAALALLDVDELLRQQAEEEVPPLPTAAVQDLKQLQQRYQDIAVLACSRGIDQSLLQGKGIPEVLLARLQAAFGHALQDDGLWSRLGNAKYHIFTQGARFGERKHRHGRGGRKSRRREAEAEGNDSTGAAPSAIMAEPMHVPVSRWLSGVQAPADPSEPGSLELLNFEATPHNRSRPSPS